MLKHIELMKRMVLIVVAGCVHEDVREEHE